MNSNDSHCNSTNILEEEVYIKLENYTDSHPNIVSLWKEYIKLKRINYMKSLVDCDAMITTLSVQRDISVETIALLYALFDR